MNAGEQGLRRGDCTFELLHDLCKSVADLGLLFELGLEVAEDGGVEQRGLGRHVGVVTGLYV